MVLTHITANKDGKSSSETIRYELQKFSTGQGKPIWEFEAINIVDHDNTICFDIIDKKETPLM